MCYEPGNHCLRAFFRQRLVRRGVALIVRVAFDAQFQVGVLLQKFHDFAEDIFRTSLDRCLAGIEKNAVHGDTPILVDFFGE